jgi:type I restriction enzyme S subunit
MDTLIGAVPEGWRVALLQTICDIQAGPSGSLIRSSQHSDSGGVSLVRPKDIWNHKIATTGVTRVPEEIAETLTRYRLAAGDIVCTRTGEPGRPALVTKSQDGWLYSTGLLRLRPHEMADSALLVSYLALPAVQHWIYDRTTATTALRSITTRALGRLPIVLPPLDVQAQISAALSSLDEKIKVHEEIVRTTSRLRDTVAQLILTGTMPVPRS